LSSFKTGKKDYAQWKLKQITSTCVECHSSLPERYPSSFQKGELVLDESKFKDPYNLGIGQLIVRRYFEAKASFRKSVQDHFISNEMTDILLPMKQLVLIDTKILKNADDLYKNLLTYQKKKNLPPDVVNKINRWLERLRIWKNKKIISSGIKNDAEAKKLINKELLPLEDKITFDNSKDIDLLFVSGLLANYLYRHPKSKLAPDIGFWIGWTEKYLKADNYFETGDLYFQQCILKYSDHPIAQKCLSEYKDSVIFDFTGSSGTHLPPDVQRELNFYESLINQKKESK
jgi:hypothetical protein